MTSIQPKSERDFAEFLLRNREQYSPLRIERISNPELEMGGPGSPRIGLLLELGYRDRTCTFQVESKGRSAPSIVQSALFQLRTMLLPGRYPILALPYLSPAIIPLLEEAGVSGIDLNGNYFIVTPDLVAIRLDRPNRYREPKQIRNIYAGNSSIVGRFLLAEPGPFQQVNTIAAGIASLGGGITLGTISKVLNGLADDLIVDRSRGKINLIQPRRLLERLREAYRSPKVIGTLRLKLPGDLKQQQTILDEQLGPGDWIWSGESSSEAYAVTTRSQLLTAWTRAEGKQINRLEKYVESRFYNVEVRRSDDSFVYFNRNGQWASRIECYLALWQLDKREREIAADIEEAILKEAGANA